MSTLILSGSDVRELLDMSEVMEVVEQGLRDLASGKALMPAKAYMTLEKGDFRAMPAALPGAAGIKWVSVYPENPQRMLPTVMAAFIHNDRTTGYPLMIMAATDSTAYRTGAVAAIASKYLARKDSKTLGIIGAGRQAQTQLMAHARVFKFEAVRVYDRSEAAVQRFVQMFPEYPVKAATLQEAAASDIVCTVTPAHEPVLKREWVLPGTHINAIGADAPGKEELEPSILKGATIVVDDIEQASNGGEINVPLRQGLLDVKDLYGTLDEIVSGKKPGRQNAKTVTVFDSTGIAIQDLAVAQLLYKRAGQRGIGLKTEFV